MSLRVWSGVVWCGPVGWGGVLFVCTAVFVRHMRMRVAVCLHMQTKGLI